MFGKKKEAGGSTYEYLIAGLGNPGAKYETTRHNAGFLCVTMLEDKYNFKAKKLKFHALIGDTYIGTHRCIVMKPQTMMNNSGEAIKECAAFYKIPPENIVVIFDDISLEPGRSALRKQKFSETEARCARKAFTIQRPCLLGARQFSESGRAENARRNRKSLRRIAAYSRRQH